jgi:hypothetical protein
MLLRRIHSLDEGRAHGRGGRKNIRRTSREAWAISTQIHFVSAIPNAGPYTNLKGLDQTVPFGCSTSSLKTEDGVVTVPTGPGSGIEIDPAFIRKHRVVEGSAEFGE